jgi:hypothetical protein
MFAVLAEPDSTTEAVHQDGESLKESVFSEYLDDLAHARAHDDASIKAQEAHVASISMFWHVLAHLEHFLRIFALDRTPETAAKYASLKAQWEACTSRQDQVDLMNEHIEEQRRILLEREASMSAPTRRKVEETIGQIRRQIEEAIYHNQPPQARLTSPEDQPWYSTLSNLWKELTDSGVVRRRYSDLERRALFSKNAGWLDQATNARAAIMVHTPTEGDTSNLCLRLVYRINDELAPEHEGKWVARTASIDGWLLQRLLQGAPQPGERASHGKPVRVVISKLPWRGRPQIIEPLFAGDGDGSAGELSHALFDSNISLSSVLFLCWAQKYEVANKVRYDTRTTPPTPLPPQALANGITLSYPLGRAFGESLILDREECRAIMDLHGTRYNPAMTRRLREAIYLPSYDLFRDFGPLSTDLGGSNIFRVLRACRSEIGEVDVDMTMLGEFWYPGTSSAFYGMIDAEVANEVLHGMDDSAKECLKAILRVDASHPLWLFRTITPPRLHCLLPFELKLALLEGDVFEVFYFPWFDGCTLKGRYNDTPATTLSVGAVRTSSMDPCPAVTALRFSSSRALGEIVLSLGKKAQRDGAPRRAHEQRVERALLGKQRGPQRRASVETPQPTTEEQRAAEAAAEALLDEVTQEEQRSQQQQSSQRASPKTKPKRKGTK